MDAGNGGSRLLVLRDNRVAMVRVKEAAHARTSVKKAKIDVRVSRPKTANGKGNAPDGYAQSCVGPTRIASKKMVRRPVSVGRDSSLRLMEAAVSPTNRRSWTAG